MRLWRELRFILCQLRVNYRNERALTTSFIIQVVGMFLSNLSFFVIWMLFSQSIGPVNGWGVLQTFGMLSTSILVFGICHTIFGAIWVWTDLVPTGAFDVFLTKPKNLYTRILGHRFSVGACGDLIQGVIGVTAFLVLADANILQCLTLLALMIPACVVQISFLMIVCCTIFWIPQASSIGQSLGNLILLPATQPISILDGPLRTMYLFFIPALLVAGLPIETLMKPNIAMIFLSYAVAAFWLALSYYILKISVARYESGNSVG